MRHNSIWTFKQQNMEIVAIIAEHFEWKTEGMGVAVFCSLPGVSLSNCFINTFTATTFKYEWHSCFRGAVSGTCPYRAMPRHTHMNDTAIVETLYGIHIWKMLHAREYLQFFTKTIKRHPKIFHFHF